MILQPNPIKARIIEGRVVLEQPIGETVDNQPAVVFLLDPREVHELPYSFQGGRPRRRTRAILPF